MAAVMATVSRVSAQAQWGGPGHLSAAPGHFREFPSIPVGFSRSGRPDCLLLPARGGLPGGRTCSRVLCFVAWGRCTLLAKDPRVLFSLA